MNISISASFQKSWRGLNKSSNFITHRATSTKIDGIESKECFTACYTYMKEAFHIVRAYEIKIDMRKKNCKKLLG